MTEQRDTTQEFEEALKRLSQEKYVLRLFVAGMNPKSFRPLRTSSASARRTCQADISSK